MINYYTIDDFHTIVVEKSTYEELREVSIRKVVHGEINFDMSPIPVSTE